MTLILRLFLSLFLSLFSAPCVSAFSTAESFVQSCAFQGANLTANWLGMYCQNEHVETFGYNYTWLDLNHCVGNKYGALMALDSGRFSQSCQACMLSHGGSLHLNCLCANLTGQFVGEYVSIDLGPILYNAGGLLGCYSHVGNISARP